MRLPCWLVGHDWNLLGTRIQNHFENDSSTRPYKTVTLFLMQCDACGTFKTKELNGGWDAKIKKDLND